MRAKDDPSDAFLLGHRGYHPMREEMKSSTTCLACFKSHVKCERSIPCKRCMRLNLRCVPNPRPRGRPKKGVATVGVSLSPASDSPARARPPHRPPPPMMDAPVLMPMQPPPSSMMMYSRSVEATSAVDDREATSVLAGMGVGELGRGPPPLVSVPQHSLGIPYGSSIARATDTLAPPPSLPPPPPPPPPMMMGPGPGQLVGLNGGGAPAPPRPYLAHMAPETALEMIHAFVELLRSGQLSLDRTRQLLLSWYLFHTESGLGPRALVELKEMAQLIGLALPQTAGPGFPPGPRLQTEDREIRRFLQLCVDEDGSAISWALYSRGSLSTHCNARFAAMYMNENELEAAVAQDNCRAEVVWRRLMSSESEAAYDDMVCQACFRGNDEGAEACEVLKCVDRFSLEMSAFVRLRVFASMQRPVAVLVLFVLPLQLSA